MRFSINSEAMVLSCLCIVFLSVLFQKVNDVSILLKVIQVAFAAVGNLILILSCLKLLRFNYLDSLFLLIIISSLVLGILNLNTIAVAAVGFFPFINLVSLSLCTILLSKSRNSIIHLTKPEKIMFLLAILMTALLITLDYIEHWYRVLTWRTSGLIFKPSSGAILLSTLTIFYFRNTTFKFLIHIFYLFLFKAMSIVAMLSILLGDTVSRALSGKAKIILLPIVILLSLIMVYFLNQVYERSLWVSVGTRVQILQVLDIFGGGLGYGTNIAINALSVSTPVSDGTINFIKYQFGVFGIFWVMFLMIYTSVLASSGKFIIAGLLGLGLGGFNIPEIPIFSLLFPYLMFRVVKS